MKDMKELFDNEDFQRYVMKDLELTNSLYLYYKGREFLERNQPREAFILRKVTKKKVVTCRKCTERGRVLPCCPECGGKGVHNKSYQCWEVNPRKIDIEKIDRDPENGQIRYWTGYSEYFYDMVTPEYNKFAEEYPHGIHYIHFDIKEAMAEVNRLNKILEQRGEI